MIVHLTRDELADLPVGSVVTGRSKEIGPADRVGRARYLLAGDVVTVLPVVDGDRYLGTVDRDALADAPADESVRPYLGDLVPVALSTTPTGVALAELDRHGGQRLVVVDEGGCYVGLVCLRTDRRRLCVDAKRLGL